MIESNFMDKLFDGDKVEWKTLEEVTLKTSNIRWSDTNRTFKYIDLSSVCREKNIITETTEISAKNAPSRAKKLVIKDDVIFATTRPTQQRSCLITEEFSGEVTSTGYCILRAMKNEVLPKWIYYCVTSSKFKKYAEDNESGSAYPAISDAKVKAFKIPVPSLTEQERIVFILEKFETLNHSITDELAREIELRQKYYAYYRDKLLTFKDGEVEWKTLGELAENHDSMRKPITSGLRETGDIPYYGASGIVDYVKDFIFDGDFLLVSEDGANLLARSTPIAFSISGKSWVNNHAHVLKFNTYVERKYVEYYLNSIDLTPYISGAAQPKLNQRNLNTIQIPNPSLEDKERIVSTLDKFDALTTSITEGLSGEIELRQKQYEYYRDTLLSFPKIERNA